MHQLNKESLTTNSPTLTYEIQTIYSPFHNKIDQNYHFLETMSKTYTSCDDSFSSFLYNRIYRNIFMLKWGI